MLVWDALEEAVTMHIMAAPQDAKYPLPVSVKGPRKVTKAASMTHSKVNPMSKKNTFCEESKWEKLV